MEGLVGKSRPRRSAALQRFAKAGLEATHGEGAGASRVAEAGEMEDAVEDVGQELIAKAEPMTFAEGGGDIGTNHNLPVGKSKDVRGSWVAQMTLVKSAAFPGGNQNDADFRGKAAEPGRGESPKGGVQLTTKIGQARRMPSLTVDPPDDRLFLIHGGPWGNGCGGEAGFPRRRPGPCGRPAIERK